MAAYVKPKTGKLTSIYLSMDVVSMIDELRQLMIEYDRLKYGDDYVEEELSKRNKSKYGKNRVMEEALKRGLRELMIEYSRDINILKEKKKRNKKKEKKIDPLARVILDIVNPANDYVWERM